MYWFKMVYGMDSNNYYIPDSFDINCNVPENTPCLRSRCECDKELARTLYEIAGFPTPVSELSNLLGTHARKNSGGIFPTIT